MNKIKPDNINKLSQIIDLEDTYSIKEQIKLTNIIINESNGPTNLLKLLIQRRKNNRNLASCSDGIIFKNLRFCKSKNLDQTLNYYFKQGIVKLESSGSIDYTPLYKCLISNNFKDANLLTQIYLKNLAGLNHSKRQWLYFTDIIDLPSIDLQTIDNLWRIYSVGQFGFSIQREIWLRYEKNWDKLWNTIGWTTNNHNIRYPNDFTWDNTAPKGHLPLFNQIRGVQVLATLFQHPAWCQSHIKNINI